MKKLYFLFSLVALLGINSYSQTNTTPCTAQKLCPNQQVSGTPVGGSNFGITALCSNLASRPTLFYTVTITSAGEFTFIINPTQQTDYDWAVWQNVSCQNAPSTAPVRLSFDAPGPNDTGMTTSEPAGDNCEAASGGNGFLRGINVVPGDVLLIAVNFFTNSGTIPPFNLFVGGSNGGGGYAGFNCCPTNPSPNFTMTTNCANGNFSVTVTASDPSLPNHWWGLMETSVEGDVSDANTLNGGNPVQPVQGGSSTTFNNLDPSKNYYIKHGVWENGCFDWIETRIPVPKIKLDYNLTDANGNVKTTFCIGEDVYLDGSNVNTYGNGYYIDIWDATGGGLTWLAHQGTNGWATGNPNWVNITNLFQGSVTFQPNRIYRVKLAINSPCGWIETTRDFRYVCCDDSGAGVAGFGLLTHNMPSGELSVSLMPGNNSGWILSEEWCVYDAPNGNVGPYSLISCPGLVSLIVPRGKCYYITHKVRTVCGEFCSGQTICNTGCRDIIAHCGELSSPANLRCASNGGQTQLVWDPVPGAVSYVIEIQVNDPRCCRDGEPAFSLAPIEVHENSYFVNFDFRCYTWAVYAVCEDGTRSQLSRYLCMNDRRCTDVISDHPPFPDARIYPNPSKGDVKLEFESPSEDVMFSVDVYDMRGMKIKSFGNNKTTNGKHEINWNTSGLPKGVYCVNFTTEKGVLITKKLIVE